MDTKIAYPSGYPQNGAMSNSRTALQAQQTSVASISTSQHMDVNLTTAEGDKVTISLDARAAAMYGTYEKTAMDNNRLSYQKTELSMGLYEREMTFTVEGDLSREEQQDIQKALKTLDRMMNQMVNGNLKPMMANASRLKGLDTIAGLEANMSFEREVLVAEQTQVAEQSVSNGQIDAPINESAAQQTQVADLINETADQMGQVVAEAESPIERMMSFVDQLLNDYKEQMAGFSPFGAEVIDDLAERLHSILSDFNDLVGGMNETAPAGSKEPATQTA